MKNSGPNPYRKNYRFQVLFTCLLTYFLTALMLSGLGFFRQSEYQRLNAQEKNTLIEKNAQTEKNTSNTTNFPPKKDADSKPDAKRPNVLFLMADQLRFDALGCYGNEAAVTPNLDRLACEGVRFQSAYSSVPSCTPARATILTGLSPWNHGELGYYQVAEKYRNEMPRLFAEAGYQTAGIGKMHFYPQRNKHGFEIMLLDESGRVESKDFISDYRQWFKEQAPDLNPDATGIGWNSHRDGVYALPEELHPTQWTSDEAQKFLKNRDKNRPFFLKVSFARPHSPYDAPQRWRDIYSNPDKLPKRFLGDWCEKHAQRGKNLGDALWQGDLGENVPVQSRLGYYANTTFIDSEIGKILALLEEQGELENTLILFTSDHGDMLGDHHLWRKTYAYEGSAHIPMLIRCGKEIASIEPRQTRTEPVELRDVLPTLLDGAGVQYDQKQFDGRSLLSLAEGFPTQDDQTPWRDAIDLEHSTCYAAENNWTGMTDGKVKYIYFATDGTEQLFDLVNDPQELRDLVPLAKSDPKTAELLKTWRQKMIDSLAPRGDNYVKDGKLSIRKKGQVKSPNYPESPVH